MHTCLPIAINICLKYTVFSSMLEYLKWQCMFTRNPPQELEERIRKLHEKGRVNVCYEVPVDILQIEDYYVSRSLRRLIEVDSDEVDLLRYRDDTLYTMLHQFRGLKLIMLAESLSFEHDEVEWHAYALHYCTVKEIWYKADENQPFRTRLSFVSQRDYDWSILIRRILILSIEVTHATKRVDMMHNNRNQTVNQIHFF